MVQCLRNSTRLTINLPEQRAYTVGGAVGDVEAEIAKAVVVYVAAEAMAGRQTSYQTYTKSNPTTGEVYTGRTSGTGSPKQNISTRNSGHHMNEATPAD